MRKLNLIVVFNKDLTKGLFCIRAKEPYKGKYNFVMDLNYFKYENNLQVYYGILKHDVNLVEEKNKLEWVELNKKLLDNDKFGGNYNIPHIITQIKVFLENGIGLGKY